jgi:peptidyl-prolyl cis-trans isomerase C
MIFPPMILAVALAAPGIFADQKPEQTIPPSSLPAEVVVARVDGQPITDKQVLNAINQIAQSRQDQLTPDQLQTKEVFLFSGALNSLIENQLLLNEARARKIAPSQFSIDREFLYYRGRFPDINSYRRALAAQGLDEAQLLKNIETDLTLNQLLRESAPFSEATDADVRKFYDTNPQYFEEQPAQIHLAHIFLKVESSAAPRKKAEVKKRLEDLRAEIGNGKMSFEEAAVKFSEDRENAAKGGEWGTFKAGELLSEIEQVAYATQPGTLSPIIETDFGFQLLKIFEVTPAAMTPLAKVRENIKASLDQWARESARAKFIETLKSKAKIEQLVSAAEWNKRFAK